MTYQQKQTTRNNFKIGVLVDQYQYYSFNSIWSKDKIIDFFVRDLPPGCIVEDLVEASLNVYCQFYSLNCVIKEVHTTFNKETGEIDYRVKALVPENAPRITSEIYARLEAWKPNIQGLQWDKAFQVYKVVWFVAPDTGFLSKTTVVCVSASSKERAIKLAQGSVSEDQEPHRVSLCPCSEEQGLEKVLSKSYTSHTENKLNDKEWLNTEFGQEI